MAFVADAETERLLQECVTQLALGQGTILRGGIARAIAHSSSRHCMEIAPKKTTAYTVTAYDAKGNNKSLTLTIRVK